MKKGLTIITLIIMFWIPYGINITVTQLTWNNSYPTGKSVRVPCRQMGCSCKAFQWIPSRPEDVGEFWHQRRRNFDPSTWRAKCRCKHTHEEHDCNGMKRCKFRGDSILQHSCIHNHPKTMFFRCYLEVKVTREKLKIEIVNEKA